MKPKLAVIFALLVSFVLATFGQTSHSTLAHSATRTTKNTSAPVVPAELKKAAQPFIAQGCNQDLWKHVYNPARLVVVEPCISVAGTIHHTKREADGDDHIQLKLDSKYAALLNDKNNTVQAASLVIEPICQWPAIQPDAIKPCRDFHSGVDVPQKGKHVTVLGSYVLDSEVDHGWMEIHPVTSITEE
jgi:hypothetical protein